MRSLTHPLPSPPAAPWGQVAAIYRRICLLRARGLHGEADHVHQHEFVAARAAAESSDPASGETDDRFQALLTAEENRVAEALLLAEVLAPLIAQQIHPSTAAATACSAPAPSDPFSRESVRSRPPRDPREPLPGIADLIDSMLGQERSLHHPSR